MNRITQEFGTLENIHSLAYETGFDDFVRVQLPFTKVVKSKSQSYFYFPSSTDHELLSFSRRNVCHIWSFIQFFFFFFSLRDRISKLVKGNCTCKFQVSLYTLETLPQCSLNFSFVFFACSLHCNIVCFFLSLYSSPFSTEVKQTIQQPNI